MNDDIQTRIANLKREIQETCGEPPVFGVAPGCPPEIEEAFLREVLEWERVERGQQS